MTKPESVFEFSFSRNWCRGLRKFYVRVRVGKHWYQWHFGWYGRPVSGLDRWDVL